MDKTEYKITTRTELLTDLADLSDLGAPYGLRHRQVTDMTTIAELKRIRHDFDRDITQAITSTPTIIMATSIAEP